MKFLEFIIRRAELNYQKWEELIEKWRLTINTEIYNDNEREICICVTYDENYLIGITGKSFNEYSINKNNFDMPCNTIRLTFSEKMNTLKIISFLKDFISSIENYTGTMIYTDINSDGYYIHPEWLVIRMMDK